MNKELIYTGIQYLDIGDDEQVPLGNDLALVKPNSLLLSGRTRYAQNEHEYKEAEEASRYLVYRYEQPLFVGETETPTNPDAMFYGGLMALQIVKPTNTLGFVYSGTDYGGDSINAAIERRHPIHAPEWATVKCFDTTCLSEAIALVPRVQAALAGSSVPPKNAIIALQLGLEMYAYHQYIGGLLWVMGMEAIFDSQNRNDFSKKLCNLLGADTPVFPNWTTLTAPFQRTVQQIAVDLYMLRNKLAHGVDLRSAASDKKTRVDLLKIVRLHEYSDERNYSMLLSEAACYLLCRVIQRTI